MLKIILTRIGKLKTHALPKTVIRILFFLFVASGDLVNAQISSLVKHTAFKTKYPSNRWSDSVFIFNRPAYDDSISLQATSKDKTPGWEFTWSVYNPTTRAYDYLPIADTGISSTAKINVSSGIKAIIEKGSVSDTFFVWCLINDFSVIITNKNDSGEIIYYDRDCKSVLIKSDTVVFRLWYLEPGTNSRIDIVSKYKFAWKADNVLSDDPVGSFNGFVDNPPYRDTWYIVTVTDDFKLSRSDSVFCPAIASKPSMKATYVTLDDSLEYPGKPYQYYYEVSDAVDNRSAPGKFRFDLSASENAVWYQLKFGDRKVFETQTDSEKIVHEYKLPGKYTTTLITKSPDPFNCIDSTVDDDDIELAAYKFDIPNVFSPNNDGNNDLAKVYQDNNIFRSTDISIETIEITIFDRIGKKVHEYSGNIRDWEGWDGNINDSNREAPDGVYFYCLTRRFYNKPDDNSNYEYKEEKDTGFIHLYRE